MHKQEPSPYLEAVPYFVVKVMLTGFQHIGSVRPSHPGVNLEFFPKLDRKVSGGLFHEAYSCVGLCELGIVVIDVKPFSHVQRP